MSDVKFCVHCAKRLRVNTITYDVGACADCLNSLPQYEEIRKERTRMRFQKYMENPKNREKHLARVEKVNERRRKEKLV